MLPGFLQSYISAYIYIRSSLSTFSLPLFHVFLDFFSLFFPSITRLLIVCQHQLWVRAHAAVRGSGKLRRLQCHMSCVHFILSLMWHLLWSPFVSHEKRQLSLHFLFNHNTHTHIYMYTFTCWLAFLCSTIYCYVNRAKSTQAKLKMFSCGINAGIFWQTQAHTF